MQGIHIFTFKGIPVSFQPMFIVLILILSVGIGGVAESFIFAICLILGVLIHEFGHALVAQRYHLNPEIVLHFMGGITKYPRSAGPKQDFWITLAGPLAGLIVGGIAYGILHVLELYVLQAGQPVPYYCVFIYYLSMVNLFWGVFNLIPAIPMDGSKVLNHIIARFCKNPQTALKISASISIVFVLLIMAWSIWQQSVWMIIISVFFIMANIQVAREAFSGGSSKSLKNLERVSLEAEKAYERGLIAARDHQWTVLERCGHQMKRAASDKDQLERAYEFLTIACTNLKKYDEALDYSEHARQSDAVCQAVNRCRSLL